MMIEKNIKNIKKNICGAQLIVVTKKQNVDDIKKVYQAGEKNFGENRVIDLIHKKNLLASDIKWHMIGHLQKNKVKYLIPFIHLIHSVDSLKLLIRNNCKCIVEPSGSINDQKVIDFVNKNKIKLIFSSKRVFKH